MFCDLITVCDACEMQYEIGKKEVRSVVCDNFVVVVCGRYILFDIQK